MRRLLYAVAVAVLLMVGAPAYAGGWAVTSFDDLPAEFVAGETYELSYVIRQHGETPVDVDSTAVVLRSEATGEELLFPAASAGETGRYLVEVTIPSSGSWSWEVSQDFFGPQELGQMPIVSGGTATSSVVALLRVLLPLATILAAAVLALQLRGLRQRQTQEALSASSGVGGA